MDIWFYIGIALMIWVIYDLLIGKTWSYREIWRKYEPGLYWFYTIIWFALAVSAIFSGLPY
jgi:hypothetical protein